MDKPKCSLGRFQVGMWFKIILIKKEFFDKEKFIDKYIKTYRCKSDGASIMQRHCSLGTGTDDILTAESSESFNWLVNKYAIITVK